MIYHLFTQNRKYWEKHGIPSVYQVPYFGVMWPVLIGRKAFGQVYTDVYKTMPKYSMVGLWNCGKPELLIRDPELVKIVMQTNFANFQKNPRELDPVLDSLLFNNPFFQTGEVWKNLRAVLTNGMTTGKLKVMALGVRDICGQFSTYLYQKIQANNGVLETEAQKLFSRYTAQVVASIGFGVDGRTFTEDTENFQTMGEKTFQTTGWVAFKQLLIFILPSLGAIFRISFIPKTVDQYFRGVIRDVLKARRQGIQGNDFIQHLYDTYKSDNGEIDENFVAGHAFSFFIDGFLTSSFTLGFVAYELATHQDIQEKLRQDINRVLQQHDGEINYEMIQDLKYMDQVIKESMRRLPVLSVMPKECTKQIKLIGSDGLQCVLNPGDTVHVPPLAIQNDSKYWDNPDVFDPDRFSDDQKNDHQKFVYMPFGAGPRSCPGMRMAQLQLKGALTVLLKNFTMEISPKTKLPLTFDPTGFLNTPQGGIWLNIKRLS